MANNEFQVPQSEHSLDTQVDEAFFEAVSGIESELSILDELNLIHEEIKSFRESATEDTIPKKWWQKLLEPLVPQVRSLHDRLVDYESTHGHKVFGAVPDGTKRRFFVLEGRWYFEEQTPHGEYVISYEIGEIIHKNVNGKLVSFDDNEIERLLQAARLYRDIVRENIYPIDAALADLIAEETHDTNKSDYDLAA